MHGTRTAAFWSLYSPLTRMRFFCAGSMFLLAALGAMAQSTPADVSADTAAAQKETPGVMSRATSAVVKTSMVVSQTVRDEVLRMRDFFDIRLPGALGRNNLVFDFEPKAGDLVRRKFVRMPFEVRYGLTSKLEIYGGLTPVMPNPFKTGEDHKWSLGMGKLGLRKDLSIEPFYFKKITYGFETLVPIGEPPTDLIDHYIHLRPFISTSRQLESLKDTTLFLAITYDQAVTCPSRGDIPSNVERRNVTEVAPGLLYKPCEFGAFAQYGISYLSQADKGDRFAQIGRLGLLWDMPLKRSQQWKLPGKWQFELGYKVSVEQGDKVDHGVHARVRWKTDFFKRRHKDQ